MSVQGAMQWIRRIDKLYAVAAAIIGAVTALMIVTRKLEGIASMPVQVDSVRIELRAHNRSMDRIGRAQTGELHKIYCVNAFKAPLAQRDCLLEDPLAQTDDTSAQP